MVVLWSICNSCIISSQSSTLLLRLDLVAFRGGTRVLVLIKCRHGMCTREAHRDPSCRRENDWSRISWTTLLVWKNVRLYESQHISTQNSSVTCTKRQFLCVFLLIASCRICIECFKLLADSTDMQFLVRVLAIPHLLRVRQTSL